MAAEFAKQGTLAQDFEIAGRSLHTGRRCRVHARPADPGHGIVFHRRIGERVVAVPARIDLAISQPLCTALRAPDGTIVRTVEHLLAAFMAMGIDNAAIGIDEEELPIFDGSAMPWVDAITRAGRIEQPAPRSAIRVLAEVEYRDDKHHLVIEPAPRYEIQVSNELAGFGPMNWQGPVTAETFRTELAASRSFGRIRWALPAMLYGFLTGKPLLRGARLSSTAAILGSRIIGGMRLPQEPVRHRALDIVGDLALAGCPIIGRVRAKNPGHDYNRALLCTLLAKPDAWERVDLG